MNQLDTVTRAAILRCLVDGASVRATARITGTSKATVLKLLVDLGEFCSIYQDHVLTGLQSTRVEADEIWAFVGVKQRNAVQDGHGDIWTFTAIDADSKLMISWLVGGRSSANARSFMEDVASRLANRVQLTTDGHHMYLTAVGSAFGYNKVDYAQLVKTYGQVPDLSPGRRYSPAVCTGILCERVMGKPDPDLVSTSYVERANLSMRMGMRRFTRLTNGFSKKAENHAHAVSLYFMHYNFCWVHSTLTKAKGGVHQTPAMAAGITDRVWKIEDILALMEPEVVIGGEKRASKRPEPLQTN
jgi:IS1 family transposase